AREWILRPFHRISDSHRRNPGAGVPHVLGRSLKPDPAPPQLLGNDQGASGTGERIQDYIVRVRAATDDPFQQPLGHLATVEPGTFLERAGDAGEVPGIVLEPKGSPGVLRTQDPRVIRYAPARIGPAIAIDQLSCGFDSNFPVVEGEVHRIFDE